MLSFEERGKFIRDAIEKGEEPLEVNCTGVYEDNIRNIQKILSAEVFNEKTGRWDRVILTEYHDACPICGKFIKVRAIIGTTWLAACCGEHSRQAFEQIEDNCKKRTAMMLSCTDDKECDDLLI